MATSGKPHRSGWQSGDGLQWAGSSCAPLKAKFATKVCIEPFVTFSTYAIAA